MSSPRTFAQLAERISAEPNSGCWLWTGSVDGAGYGSIVVRGKYWGAHRYFYEHLVGPIPPKLELDHLCRVPCCVNPAHLEPVTKRENILRGVGASAQHARVTHCPAGHPYSGHNLYRLPDGRRQCRRCIIDAGRRYRQRKKVANQ